MGGGQKGKGEGDWLGEMQRELEALKVRLSVSHTLNDQRQTLNPEPFITNPTP